MININTTELPTIKYEFSDLSMFCSILFLPKQQILIEKSPFSYNESNIDNLKFKFIYFQERFVAIITEQPINGNFIFFKNQDSAILVKQFIISYLGHIEYTYPTINLI